MKKHNKLLVVIGTGSDNLPRAARAKGSQEQAVRKAADLMGCLVGAATSAKARQLADQLPELRLYASGRGLVPRIKLPLYDQLLAALRIPAAKPVKLAAADLVPLGALEGLVRNPWGEIEPGSIVLAQDELWAGWFEARVVGIERDGQVLLLRWRDWPTNKPFAAARTSVAIPPTARPNELIHLPDQASGASAAHPVTIQ